MPRRLSTIIASAYEKNQQASGMKDAQRVKTLQKIAEKGRICAFLGEKTVFWVCFLVRRGEICRQVKQDIDG
jgi:hypothetical protein